MAQEALKDLLDQATADETERRFLALKLGLLPPKAAPLLKEVSKSYEALPYSLLDNLLDLLLVAEAGKISCGPNCSSSSSHHTPRFDDVEHFLRFLSSSFYPAIDVSLRLMLLERFIILSRTLLTRIVPLSELRLIFSSLEQTLFSKLPSLAHSQSTQTVAFKVALRTCELVLSAADVDLPLEVVGDEILPPLLSFPGSFPPELYGKTHLA